MLQQPFILCMLHVDGARHTMLFGGKEFKYFITCLGRLAWGGVDWIRLAQDRDRWWAVVSAVMNLRVLAPRS
jgi:hypothetical protein